MKRGEVWTVSEIGYAGKPRPCVVLQSDAFDALASVTVCLLTSNETSAPLYRIEVSPSKANGLRYVSRLMTDKLMTVPRTKLKERVGRLEGERLAALSRAVIAYLDLAGTSAADG